MCLGPLALSLDSATTAESPLDLDLGGLETRGFDLSGLHSPHTDLEGV